MKQVEASIYSIFILAATIGAIMFLYALIRLQEFKIIRNKIKND